ncbi:MAG: TadE/TadG family type IV pilus assembly protein [Bacillota bacterium]
MWRWRGGSQRGQAMVELALVLPIVLVLLFGVMTFGIAVNTKIATATAAREAARDYAVNKSVSDAVDRARSLLRAALPVSDAEFWQSFDPNRDVSVEVSGGYVTVTVTYHQPVYVPGLLTVLRGSRLGDASGRLALSSAATFRLEQ